MNYYILFFRGINVGGKNILKMKDLKNALSNAEFQHVKSYIQSGNLIIGSAEKNIRELENNIEVAVRPVCDFEPNFLLIPVRQFKQMVQANPFPKTTDEPKSLHCYFLRTKPGTPDMDKLDSIAKQSEQFELIDRVFYLHAPEGIGRSKLASNIEKAMGVDTTARNWRTVEKMLELATAEG